jgi:hypothetical protein
LPVIDVRLGLETRVGSRSLIAVGILVCAALAGCDHSPGSPAPSDHSEIATARTIHIHDVPRPVSSSQFSRELRTTDAASGQAKVNRQLRAEGVAPLTPAQASELSLRCVVGRSDDEAIIRWLEGLGRPSIDARNIVRLAHEDGLCPE